MSDSRMTQLVSARRLAALGRYNDAELRLRELLATCREKREEAQITADLGAIAAVRQQTAEARQLLERARRLDPEWRLADVNLAVLDEMFGREDSRDDREEIPCDRRAGRRTRVAILSLLFNWPSTGGGTVHTTETALFLSRAGYEVRHFSARFPDWELGMIREEPPFPVTSIDFSTDEWEAETIRRRFCKAVDSFAPDRVIVTDSWNTKPLLAESVSGYPFFLRLAAQECLCPLNNLRLLSDDRGGTMCCPRNQLDSPAVCRECVAANDRYSGGLHRAERRLAGFDNGDYPGRLCRVFADAEAVLVVNPVIAAMVSPFARRVEVIPSGFDASRFPWPWPDEEIKDPSARQSIVFAGVCDDFIKGFHVLRAACDQLWRQRRDFKLIVTSDSRETAEPYARYIGWQSQADLPAVLRQADVVAFPTVAEDALGRVAVEAMAVGRPVVASQIGGLPFTVTDGLTGLLFEPGNADDLADKLAGLLDDRERREEMGAAGRRCFEERFDWKQVIERQYVPLLGSVMTDNPLRKGESAP